MKNSGISVRVCRATGAVFTLAVLIFCIHASGQAQKETATQQQSTKPEATFSSHTELVLVPVVVTDGRGGHITGLKKEDFSLGEDGAGRKISVFEEVVATSASAAKTKSPNKPQGAGAAKIFTNDASTNSARRVVIFALDTVNTPVTDQAYARKQILKYLAQGIDPDMMVSLVMFTPGGVKVIHDFTTDTSVLIAALSKLKGKTAFAQQIPQTQPIDPVELQTELDELSSFADSSSQTAAAGQRQLAVQWTYDNLNQIAHAFSGVPGRKSLIWVSSGIPFSLAGNNTQVATIGNGDVSDNLYAYEHTWQALANASFAVYPVDARGLVNPAMMSANMGSSVLGSNGRVQANPAMTPQGAMSRNRTHNAALDTFKDLADMTGGEAFYNTNDLGKSFRQASDDSSRYYVLGFYLGKDEKPGWHKLKVQVSRSGAQVRTRSGFLVAKADEQRDRNTDVASALVSPFDFTGLPIQMRWTVQSKAPKDVKTTAWFDVGLAAKDLTLDESDNNHVKVEVIAVAKLADGTVAGQIGQTIETNASPEKAAQLRKAGLIYSNNLSLPAGHYSVRFVVHDWLSGRVGSLSVPLLVE